MIPAIHLTARLCEYCGEHRRIVIERVLVASRVNGSVPANDILEIYLHLAQHSVVADKSDVTGLAVAPARSHHRRRSQRVELSIGEHYGLYSLIVWRVSTASVTSFLIISAILEDLLDSLVYDPVVALDRKLGGVALDYCLEFVPAQALEAVVAVAVIVLLSPRPPRDSL